MMMTSVELQTTSDSVEDKKMEMDSENIKNRESSRKTKMKIKKKKKKNKMEFRVSSETIEQVKKMEMGLEKIDKDRESDKKMKNRRKKKKNRMSSFIRKFGCFRSGDDGPTIDRPDGDGNFDMESACAGMNRGPTHLVITINGIIGSAHNWRFAAKQLLKKYPQDVIVHCSESNCSMLTFDGVDVMGDRLADEVISVIERYPGLQKISFIGHSLGGLIARYAIAKLYGRVVMRNPYEENEEFKSNGSSHSFTEEKFKCKIAGLEPMNFITSATPHLGSRGHKQTPAFFGSYKMEKVASRASWLLGRTGRHLFLTDGDEGKPPLLLQMVSDSDDLQFISALQSFKRRVAYSNARFDVLVGWSTSSLRRRSELPRHQSLSRSDKYPHIVNVEAPKIAYAREEISSAAQLNKCKTIDMEEAMITALTKLSWERVDVDFSGSKQRFLAHSTIQVKNHLFSDGADVIQHMVDNFLL